MGKNDFCCTPNCSNRRNRKENIQFYRICKDKELWKIWLLRIRRKQFKPTANTRLCSEQFVGGLRSMDPSSASYYPSVFFHTHKKSNAGRNTLSRSTIPNDQGDHEPKRHSQKCRPGAKFEMSVESKIWGQCLPESSSLKCHDYLKRQINLQSLQFAELYPGEFNELQELYIKIAQLEEENYKLRERCISLDEIQQSPDSCQFWTGFPNYGTLKALFGFLNEAAHLKKNWRGQAAVESRHFSEAYKSKPGPTSNNSNEEEFLMVMIRLRAGIPLRDLAHQQFGLSVFSVSKKCTAWINI
ncbi:THAP domain-containing protein 11, partial [Acropora cervicornis]